jgi:hypothetical protein
MPRQAWIDFLRQHRQAHLVAAVLIPPRTAAHLRRLRGMLNQLIGQERQAQAFATTIVRNEGIVEIHCGFADKKDADHLARLSRARAAAPRAGWSSHRSFKLSAGKEVALAGALAPKGGG